MFTVEYHSHGLLRQTYNDIQPYKHKNMWRIPDFEALVPYLAPKVRQALQRSTWSMECSDMLRADLFDKRGKPIGTLFARWK